VSNRSVQIVHEDCEPLKQRSCKSIDDALWWQLVVKTTAPFSEAVSDHLIVQGAVSVTFRGAADQALYELTLGEPLLWDTMDVIGLFDVETDTALVLASLQLISPQLIGPASVEFLADQDWNRAWMSQFHPISFADKLWICPSWLPIPDPHAINVILDPGMAFGTGTHPTTALMLEWLSEQALTGKQLIDYGCGSGILAIAAAKLGATVIAVDNDPNALVVTLENAEMNQLRASQLTTYLPQDLPSMKVDILLANILAQPLMALAPHLAEHVSVDGVVVLSGILPEQAESVSEQYKPWFNLSPAVIKDGWVRLEGVRMDI